jgi:tetratricopeptide (TPR) repeat protein
MAENPRIEDLRRRVQKDPASIAFAQLAEEHRRAGQVAESVEVCRAGLAIHPSYLSARVTLGRALIELGQLDDARGELDIVLKSAPENLAAIRGVAEICHKQGALDEALRHYKAALAIARNDPELEQTVSDLSRQVAPAPRPVVDNSLSLDEMRLELNSIVAEGPVLAAVPPVRPAAPAEAAALQPAAVQSAAPVEPELPVQPVTPAPPAAAAAVAWFEPAEPAPFISPAAVSESPTVFATLEPVTPPTPPATARPEEVFAAAPPMAPSPHPEPVAPLEALIDPAVARAHETIAVFEQWLDAIHGSRAN